MRRNEEREMREALQDRFAGSTLQANIIRMIADLTGEGKTPYVTIETLNKVFGEDVQEILPACDELKEESPQPIDSGEVGETTVFWVTDFGRDMYDLDFVEKRQVFQDGGERGDVYRSNGVKPQSQVDVSYSFRVREELEEILGKDHAVLHRIQGGL